MTALGQNIPVTGTITDSTSGQGIPQVTVTEKGSRNSTTTSNAGTFSLLVSPGAVLVISSVGYQKKDFPVNNQRILSMQLQQTNTSLGEVVVVGYGRQKKVNLTGAVAQISSEAIRDRPNSTLTQALQGQMPGLQIVNSGGAPGRERTFIRMRGISTMNQGSAGPLVIIDGIESSLNDINPEDVASVSVLKDAASAAIYGSRAANGVVLVTTKRGRTGRPSVSYSGYFGWQDLVYKPAFVDSWDYATLINKALIGEGGNRRYTDDEIAKFRNGSDPDHYPNSNYSKEMYKNNGLQQSHTAQLSGGNEAVKYFFSMGYLDQNGRTYASGYKRLAPRLNLDAKVNSWLSVGTSGSITVSDIQDAVWGGLVRQVHRIPSVTVFKYSNGMYGKGADGNPVGWMKDGGSNLTNDTRVFQTFYAEVSPLTDLKIRGSYTINSWNHKQYNRRYDMYYGDGSSQKDNLGESAINFNNTATWIVQANYNKNIGREHHVGAVAGFQYEYYKERYNYLSRSGFPNNSVYEINAANPATAIAQGSSAEDKTASYFARLNYDFKGKYLLEGNFRIDGSSRFAPENRWGYFPSVSAGWRISEEDFMKGIGWLNNLKLRTSWGSLGNNRGVSRYYYMQRIALGTNYAFNNNLTTGATQTTANNEDIRWERTIENNIGLDATLFSRIDITLDAYNRRTKDILSSIPVSPQYGLPAPVINTGALRNRGIELQVGYNSNIGNFKYRVSGNMAYNRNVVTSYATPSIGDRIYQQGHKWGEFYGWEWTGFFATDQEALAAPHQVGAPVKAGDLKFKDQNKDGKIDGNDRIYLGGSDVPDYTFGLNLNGEFKGFDLTIFFQGAAKVKELMQGDAFYAFSNGGNLRTWQANYAWTPENTDARYPRLTVNQTHNQTTSGFSVKDRDYVRLKNLQIGYTLSDRLTRHLRIERARFYITGSNLLTFQKNGYLQWDPEMISAGNGIYSQDPHDVVPLMKVYAIGLNVSF